MQDVSALKRIGQLWSNETYRAWINQIVVLGLLGSGLIALVLNTASNLKARGLSSGFGFLQTESGFGISETPPVPRLEGGFLMFIGSCALGILLYAGLHLWLKRRRSGIGERTWSVVLGLALLVGLPAAVLYLTGSSTPTDVYEESSTYGLALKTGLLNTLKVSVLGCVLATLLGFLIGLGRLSNNWLASRLAETYVEILRNVPLLVQIFFWYHGVLRALPGVRQSVRWGEFMILNNRGIYTPAPVPQAAAGEFGLAVVLGLCLSWLWWRRCLAIQERTGVHPPLGLPILGLILVPPALVWLVLGAPFAWDKPVLEGFNYRGGLTLTPEYAAMLIALVAYTATFIAEIVRSGVQAVSIGQREAARAMGLRPSLVMRLVILPQSLRVIIPPLTSQYLNLIKNSSLGAAVAYPEIVNVGGTILNQSGQAIEVIALTMAFYLTISLLISMGLNWYNARVRLQER